MTRTFLVSRLLPSRSVTNALVRVTAGFWVIALAAPAGAQAPRSAVLDLRGKPAWTSTESFSAVGSAAFFPAGAMVVIAGEPGKMELLGVSPTGAMRRISRSGDGPGEFRSPIAVFGRTDTTAVVVDLRLMRSLTVTASRAIATTSLSQPPGHALWYPQYIDGAQREYAMATALRAQTPTLPLTRWSPATGRLDTVISLPIVPLTMSKPRKTSDGNLVLNVQAPPMMRQDQWTVCRDGTVAIARVQPFRIELISAAGQRRTGPIVPKPPVRISQSDRDSVVRTGIAAGDIPEYLPPFLDQGGWMAETCQRFWLEVTTAGGARTPTWMGFDKLGAHVATAVLKPFSRIVAFGAGKVLVARRDPADDLVYLELYPSLKP